MNLRFRRLAAAALGTALIFAIPAAGHAQEGLANHDTSQPIEINADRLEVQREQGVAIFSGNVDAIQGKMRLRTDKLTVHYRPDGSGGTGAQAQGAISRMEAEGRVFLSSPSETAQGARGIYDVEKRQVTMNGQVVLTRGKNVVRGDRLVLDLVSGISRVESAADATGQPRQRVKGLFVPEKKN